MRLLRRRCSSAFGCAVFFDEAMLRYFTIPQKRRLNKALSWPALDFSFWLHLLLELIFH